MGGFYTRFRMCVKKIVRGTVEKFRSGIDRREESEEQCSSYEVILTSRPIPNNTVRQIILEVSSDKVWAVTTLRNERTRSEINSW